MTHLTFGTRADARAIVLSCASSYRPLIMCVCVYDGFVQLVRDSPVLDLFR